MKLLDDKDSILIVIDIQEKLVKATKGEVSAIKASKLVKAADILSIPVIISEQYPKGLGYTVEEIKNCLPPNNAYTIEKTAFSLLKKKGFLDKLKSYGRKQVVICGIETHICVYQTVVELLNSGFSVYLVKDACASRNIFEHELSVDAMRTSGAEISTVERVLFEWLRDSKHPKFKDIQALIK